jgi:hypothetical protein
MNIPLILHRLEGKRTKKQTPSMIFSQAISWCHRSTNLADERVGWSLPASPMSKDFISMQSKEVPHSDDLTTSALRLAALSVLQAKEMPTSHQSTSSSCYESTTRSIKLPKRIYSELNFYFHSTTT